MGSTYMDFCGEYKQIKDVIPILRDNEHVMNLFLYQ